jgi:hypothetical protein
MRKLTAPCYASLSWREIPISQAIRTFTSQTTGPYIIEKPSCESGGIGRRTRLRIEKKQLRRIVRFCMRLQFQSLPALGHTRIQTKISSHSLQNPLHCDGLNPTIETILDWRTCPLSEF